tara:strand:+ start:739 stop:2202 length:1464 start_codon:yes stop_codon:yes gene_type:complete
MGLRDGKTDKDYYNGQEQFGGYQFTSLLDIINQFIVAYVGESKIIPKVSKLDVAFHAQRALQELSFDTLKSFKAQQIEVPPSLQMTLPHDYVNYTKLSWVDSSGIKHPLYPTSSTSNPFQIRQEDDGSYSFPEEAEEVVNGGFDSDLENWITALPASHQGSTIASVAQASGTLSFNHRTRSSHGSTNWGHIMYAYQEIDVSDKSFVDLSADGTAVDMTNGTGTIRVGLTTQLPDSETKNIPPPSAYPQSNNVFPSLYDIPTVSGEVGYIEWTTTTNTTSKEILNIDVSQHDIIYVVVVSFHDYTAAEAVLTATNSIDNISVTNNLVSTTLSHPLNQGVNSSTWNNYKAGTPSENQDDYQDDTYWPMEGSRYGLDPQHAQANGSYFIDQRLGKIHFSSNISGKTVILDYISDSLGTNAEMQVHKFAEEAMYKHMVHAIVSTSSWGQQLVPRLTKEKFAAIRKAKLRLSNIKLEELTQILRGKSKQIKH